MGPGPQVYRGLSTTPPSPKAGLSGLSTNDGKVITGLGRLTLVVGLPTALVGKKKAVGLDACKKSTPKSRVL